MEGYVIRLKLEQMKKLEELLEWASVKAKGETNIYLIKEIMDAVKSAIPKQKEISYISGLSEGTKQLYFEFKKIYNKDLYHSMASILNAYGLNKTPEEYYLYYKKRFEHERPEIFQNEEYAKEFCHHVYKRLKKKVR